ncbi:hypothetical protein CALCODRAFT_248949 [Calocera cornea HHB12733]|uniref:F-box domain-containing protein n=1 Tax=Calocera cornea HHB12733 TaxID=1353952 RepID=A0A165JVV6_9BASI|nr:hypothetical protein CALCODRAFT_248949 [Calocera cornea HHB12733]
MAPTFKSLAFTWRTRRSTDHRYKKQVPSHGHVLSNAASMDKLPLELCELVLRHLPPMFAWRCRSVCRSWRHYIEDVLSRDWFIGSRLLMMYINHPRMLVLDTGNNRYFRLTRGDLILDLVARDGDFLVFKFTESSKKALSVLSEDDIRLIRDFWPLFVVSSALRPSLLRSLRQLLRKEVKLYIVTPDVGMRLAPLVSGPSKIFSRKKPRQDFKLQPPDSLLVDRRVLFSKLFGEADFQDAGPGLPYLSHCL